MVIIAEYTMGEEVYMKKVELVGKIIEIILRGNNLIYTVEYWWNADIKFAQLYEEDIEHID